MLKITGSEKRVMKDRKNRTQYKIHSYLIGLSCAVLLVIGSRSNYGLASKPPVVDSGRGESAEREVAAGAGLESAAGGVVGAACELICKGDFEAAGRLIEGRPSQYDVRLGRLQEVVHAYRGIRRQRQADREKSYREQLSELEKVRVSAGGTEVNDVNSVVKALSVITKASEVANDKQKGELLSNRFVKQVFGAAKARGAEFEAEGKWLDSYITCYSWLQAVEPDNEGYSDHAEELVEKANIVASFRDNPCESREERYENVEKQMFVRAVDALNFNYVNIIDYRQMASKGVGRCKLLGEVISSSAAVREALWGKDSPHTGEVLTWMAALEVILSEIEQPATGFSKDKFVGIFEKVLAVNKTTLELPRTLLIAQFAEGAFSALDPYTVMVWPRQVQDFEKTMTNEFTGIGIEITKQKGLLTVASLLPDTPAYNSGLDAGDVIEEVDGVQTKDMSLTCAVHKITGPAGTKVRLRIKREGEDERRDITITRAKIVVPTIRGWRRAAGGKWLYMIDDENKIGYVRVTSFSASTASDLDKVLSELEGEGLKGLVLDLRFNSGGLLDSAVEVADKFLSEGLIVRTQPRWGVPTWATAKKEKTHPDYPLVILVNRYSASASEIVSGALQDETYRRAIVVGERTVGKGLVQGITPYPGGGAQLKYTMAYYHLPSGQKVKSRDEAKKRGEKDWGIGPNVEIELTSDELRTLLDVQRDNDVLVQADHRTGSAPLKRRSLDETISSDVQLAVGILVAKTKVITEEARGGGRQAAQL
ncbi:MAG: S41 family peptidase [Planctomycetota bacterium]|jgi:carboxyl-terminal processing protease